jgi:hypothetical protein
VESEEEYSEEEAEENLDQLEEVEAEESDEDTDDEIELSGDIELEDGEYEYLVNAREYLNENGLDDIEKIKSGILMVIIHARLRRYLTSVKLLNRSEINL